MPGKIAYYFSRGDKNTEALEQVLLALGDDEHATARGLGAYSRFDGDAVDTLHGPVRVALGM